MRDFSLGTLGMSLLLVVLSKPARALSLSDFQEKMHKHVASLPGKTTAGIQIEVLAGPALFSHNEKKVMIPASNAKLVTTIAALDKLGPGFSFETKVLKQGNDLVLVGNGDPFLVSERLWLLARDVARKGLKKIESIKVSNAAFSETYRGLQSFEDSGEPFAALVSATALNFNSIEIHVTPSEGKRPSIETGPIPHSYAQLENEVMQSSSGGKGVSVKSLGFKDGKEIFLVSGSIGKNSPAVTVYGAVDNPDAYIASVFAALLRREGVSVGKDFGGMAADTKGQLIASQESLPLQDLVRLVNNYSNNFMAESTFLALAGTAESPASPAGSQQVINEFLQRHEACKDSFMANGSGLSWETRISPVCFTNLITKAYREFHSFADLLGSLPAGKQTGTLKNRFKRVGDGLQAERVRAKTGTLWSQQVVTSLTGLTTAATGEKIVFSLIENDQRSDPGLLRGLKDWEDQCVEIIQQLKL